MTLEIIFNDDLDLQSKNDVRNEFLESKTCIEKWYCT